VTLLGQLRREHPCFGQGDFRILHHGAHTIAYERRYGDDVLVIAANAGSEPYLVPLGGRWQQLLPDVAAPIGASVTVDAGKAVILREVRA
jgi:hypothetical protein